MAARLGQDAHELDSSRRHVLLMIRDQGPTPLLLLSQLQHDAPLSGNDSQSHTSLDGPWGMAGKPLPQELQPGPEGKRGNVLIKANYINELLPGISVTLIPG